ncbi:MAG: sigma-70 family RNA polymerase sigma factor [Bacteroidota bacterium]
MRQGKTYTDQELVAGCLSENRASQELFYRKFAPSALGVVRRYVQDRSEAMELLNSGMLRVFQKLHTFSWQGSLEGWVKRLVFRVVADHFRAKRQPATLEIVDWDQPTAATITHQLYAEDLCRIIETLPGVSKEVFWLFAVEGYSHAEIGEQLNLTEGTSRWHLNKARKLLKGKLQTNPLKSSRYAG